MFSRKSVGPRMEPWGTLVLTGYSYEDFPERVFKEFSFAFTIPLTFLEIIKVLEHISMTGF